MKWDNDVAEKEEGGNDKGEVVKPLLARKKKRKVNSQEYTGGGRKGVSSRLLTVVWGGPA